METRKDLTPREAAKKLGIGLDFVYTLIWSGKIVARKQANRWLIPVGAVEERARAREGASAR